VDGIYLWGGFIELLMALNQNNKKGTGKVIVTHITISSEHIAFPMTVKSKFKTIQDWLIDVCNSNKPEKPIEEYKFNYYSDGLGNYTLFLKGVNRYEESYKEKDDYYTTTNERIEFMPSNKYFKLPKGEYKKLDRTQINEKLTSQLKDFFSTEVFKTSFMANANAITTTYDGETIWSK